MSIDIVVSVVGMIVICCGIPPSTTKTLFNYVFLILVNAPWFSLLVCEASSGSAHLILHPRQSDIPPGSNHSRLADTTELAKA